MLPGLTMKLVCVQTMDLLAKLTERENVCTHVYIQCVLTYTYKYVYVRRHIERVYTWLLVGESAFNCNYFQIAFKTAIEQSAW